MPAVILALALAGGAHAEVVGKSVVLKFKFIQDGTDNQEGSEKRPRQPGSFFAEKIPSPLLSGRLFNGQRTPETHQGQIPL